MIRETVLALVLLATPVIAQEPEGETQPEDPEEPPSQEPNKTVKESRKSVNQWLVIILVVQVFGFVVIGLLLWKMVSEVP